VAPEGIALRKNDPGLTGPVTAAFNQIKSDGTYASILAKWNVSDGDIKNAG
jgi:ABC-type amino acid transport substrate-binding protein